MDLEPRPRRQLLGGAFDRFEARGAARPVRVLQQVPLHSPILAAGCDRSRGDRLAQVDQLIDGAGAVLAHPLRHESSATLGVLGSLRSSLVWVVRQ